MKRIYAEFIAWAAQYNEGHMSGRSLARHEEWMKTITCPILRIEGEMSEAELLNRFLEKLKACGAPTL